MFLGVLAAVLAILLYKNWIVVRVAKDLLLNHFNTDPTIAVILCLVTGYAEPNVTKIVTSGLEAAKCAGSPIYRSNPLKSNIVRAVAISALSPVLSTPRGSISNTYTSCSA